MVERRPQETDVKEERNLEGRVTSSYNERGNALSKFGYQTDKIASGSYRIFLPH